MKYKHSVYRSFALITQLGISMVVPIVLCACIGAYLEEKFEVPVFIPLVILGILSGGRNVYLLVRHVNEDVEEKEDEED